MSLVFFMPHTSDTSPSQLSMGVIHVRWMGMLKLRVYVLFLKAPLLLILICFCPAASQDSGLSLTSHTSWDNACLHKSRGTDQASMCLEARTPHWQASSSLLDATQGHEFRPKRRGERSNFQKGLEPCLALILTSSVNYLAFKITFPWKYFLKDGSGVQTFTLRKHVYSCKSITFHGENCPSLYFQG